ncbi:MAG: sugar nucleotide-binding protein, partial [Candidatus Magasanikbacteria bacterium]|nr:sugar nucleotide-binding protein [Candidatus Magasanikbacteria bacterium]
LEAKFIHYSTDFVFDGENENGYTEDAVLNPINAYGRSKADGEARVQKVGGEFYLIRISRLFGMPASSAAGKKSFVDIMKGFAFEKTEINLVDSERGTPTYAPDAAAATFALLTDNAPFGIYHLANSETCTWYEFGKAVFEELKAPIIAHAVTPDAFPRPAKRPRVSPLINTKRPQARSWHEALHEYLYGKS